MPGVSKWAASRYEDQIVASGDSARPGAYGLIEPANSPLGPMLFS